MDIESNEDYKNKRRIRRRNHIQKDVRERKIFHEKIHEDVKRELKINERNYTFFVEDEDDV